MADSVKGIDQNLGARASVNNETERIQREAVRNGALTGEGVRRGYVAYRPSKVFGRALVEMTGRVNDALCELELSSVAFASDMDLERWQEFHRAADREIQALRRQMDRLIKLCGYGIRAEYEEGVLALAAEPGAGEKDAQGEALEAVS